MHANTVYTNKITRKIMVINLYTFYVKIDFYQFKSVNLRNTYIHSSVITLNFIYFLFSQLFCTYFMYTYVYLSLIDLFIYSAIGANWLIITLFLLGKLGITSSFAVIYTYTAEMMPTVSIPLFKFR